MDDQRFDNFTRTLGGTSRRSMLKGLIGGAAGGALGLLGLSRSAAQPNKVGVCHVTGNGSYRYIEVSENALPAHEAHGDSIDPDFASDPTNCGDCGVECTTQVANATATCTGGECGFACNEGYQLNAAGIACESISIAPDGYETVNGGTFAIANSEAARAACHANGRSIHGSVLGSGNYLCGHQVTGTNCAAIDDCATGTACFSRLYCITPS